MKKVRNKSQAGKYAKRKGSSSERAVAKLFEKWWDVPGVSFARTPGSGSFHTKSNSKNFNAAGDIVCSDPSFPFCVENKQNESWDLAQLLTSTEGPINKFWAQAVTQCPVNKMPLLVMGKNHKKRLVVMKFKDYEELVYPCNPVWQAEDVGQFYYLNGIIVASIAWKDPLGEHNYDDTVVMSLDHFLATKPALLREHTTFISGLRSGVSNG